MRALAANGSFHVALLDGVTGSGKTEVYFEAIAEIIRRGKQTLILMPEIALTGQFLDRFAQRFGVRPLEWHSELTPRTRARNWAAIAAGEAPVVVGARSALFLPYADLGLIIVDEEHDQAYKQDDGAHYHARDMAVVRAHIAKIPIILASATPSIETEVNARKGRYQRVALPSRFGGQHMPHIEAIDLRREPPPRGRFVSPRLADYIGQAIEKREQALLFLNRRGYAPLTLCRACGHRFACTICDAWLVDHRFRQRLVCHHCGFSMPRPNICPHCAAEESLAAIGPGVERLQEEAAQLFPNARTMVLSSDLITSIETMRSELNEIAEGRVDIIIGTQLVAKGHNFPRLNLVGVVDADLGLSNGDPRAAERTFQLLNQVIGRAGRDQGRGIGYLQTHQPDHPVMKALVASDREAFYASEIDARERSGYPPFGRLASLIISAGDRPTAEGFARKLAAIAPIDERIQVLGPAEAPLAVIKGRYRFRLLVKSLRNVDLSEYLREWLAAASEDQGQSQARGRRRSAELFVEVISVSHSTTDWSCIPARQRHRSSPLDPRRRRSGPQRPFRTRCAWVPANARVARALTAAPSARSGNSSVRCGSGSPAAPGGLACQASPAVRHRQRSRPGPRAATSRRFGVAGKSCRSGRSRGCSAGRTRGCCLPVPEAGPLSRFRRGQSRARRPSETPRSARRDRPWPSAQTGTSCRKSIACSSR